MDYMVEYSVNGEIKMEVVSFEDFITSDFIEDFILDKLYELEEFEHNNFVDVKEEIPNYYKYESLVSAINTDSYDKNVISLPLIDKLETENKKNEFVYKFGEQIISRQKVLRISSVLNKCLNEFNEEMLFFAITKGSYINEEVLSKIKNDISYSFEGGVTHGLS